MFDSYWKHQNYELDSYPKTLYNYSLNSENSMKRDKLKLVRRNPFVALAIKRKAGKHKDAKKSAFARFVKTGL